MSYENLGQLSPQEEKQVSDKLTKSRIQMLMKFPFFGILSLHLQLKQDYNMSTAGTDGDIIYYNPHFIKKLSSGQISWLLMHEVLHVALGHLWRRGGRNKNRFNIAADYAIHSMLMEMLNENRYNISTKDLEPIEGMLYDSKYNDMSAEEIYDSLPDDEGDQNDGNGGGNGGGGSTLDEHDWDNAQTQQDAQQKKKEWEGKMVSAAQAAEGKGSTAGNLPGYLKRLINKIVKPQKNWKILLQEFIQPECDDYSFNPPDRRFGDYDFFLPDYNDTVETVKDIVFMVDTSGSVNDKELSVAYSEIVGAIQQFNGKLSGKLGFFDHDIYGLYDFDDVKDVLEIKPVGGGGTSFKAIFRFMEDKIKQNDNIAGVVILTDGYATWPTEKETNGLPVLWLITNEHQVPPWGLHSTLTLNV